MTPGLIPSFVYYIRHMAGARKFQTGYRELDDIESPASWPK